MNPFCDPRREREVLAYAIYAADNRPDHLTQLKALLEEGLFTTETHTALWKLIQKIPWPTLSALGDEIARRNSDGPLSLAFLVDLEDEAPSHFPIVEDHIQHLRLMATTRRARACMQKALDEGNEDPLSAAYKASLEIKSVLESSESSRLRDASLSAKDIMKTSFPVPKSILGNHLLSEGDLSVFYGVGGVGKSYLALHLALMICREKTFFGLPTHKTKVGYLSLETPIHIIQQRISDLCEEREPPDGLDFIAYPILQGGSINVLEPANEMELTKYATDRGLLIVDALSRVHAIDENKTHEMGLVMAAFDRIRNASGCALLIIHHERKTQAGGTDDDLQALRGSTRLQTDPTLLIRAKVKGDLIKISFPKSNNAPAPDSLWIQPAPDGVPLTVETPMGKVIEKDENLSALRKAIQETGGTISMKEAADSLPYPRKRVTVQAMLKEIGAESVGRFKGERGQWQVDAGPIDTFEVAEQQSLTEENFE